MAIISTTHNFIFLHIPKTAGTSIRKTLAVYQTNKPEKPEEWHEDMVKTKARVNSDVFHNMFKFTFARNPWDRMYSSYQFICHKPLNKIERIPQDYYKQIGFKRWLLEESFFVPNNIDPTPDMIPIQRKNLVDWMFDGDTQLVDFIGKFENVDSDFEFIMNTLNLPHIHLPHTASSPRKRNYREEYDKQMIDFVAEHHKRDIVLFGYDF